MFDDLTVIVPVKAHSERCPDKNFRPFAGPVNLLSLKLAQLQDAGVPAGVIRIATDSREVLAGTAFDTLDDSGHNATFAEALDYWIGQTKTNELAIVHVTCPLFDSFADFFLAWDRYKQNGCDSLFVSKEFRHFLVDDASRPVNFQYGPWHGAGSQALPSRRVMTCAAFVLYHDTAAHCHYYIGQHPAQFLDGGWHVDIDTEADFRLAQLLWKETRCPASRS